MRLSSVERMEPTHVILEVWVSLLMKRCGVLKWETESQGLRLGCLDALRQVATGLLTAAIPHSVTEKAIFHPNEHGQGERLQRFPVCWQ